MPCKRGVGFEHGSLAWAIELEDGGRSAERSRRLADALRTLERDGGNAVQQLGEFVIDDPRNVRTHVARLPFADFLHDYSPDI